MMIVIKLSSNEIYETYLWVAAKISYFGSVIVITYNVISKNSEKCRLIMHISQSSSIEMVW